MLAFKMKSPAEVMREVAANAKRRRIDADLTQRDLASMSGVSYGSVRIFEDTGKISFEGLLKIAATLDAEEEFESLFPPRRKLTIDDVIDRPKRQRVRKK